MTRNADPNGETLRAAIVEEELRVGKRRVEQSERQTMTEIPIEKKPRFYWWLWLILAAIIVAPTIWFFATRDRHDGTVGAAGNSTVYEVAADETGHGAGSDSGADAPITELAVLLNGPAGSMVGRQVDLRNVPAGSVPADAGFWIMGEGGKREYVILHEVLTPNTPIEGRIDVNKGDRLDIVGTVRSAAEGVPKDAAIPGPTAPLPKGVEHYIDAQSVTKRH